jgi:hypothetical protein
LFVFLWAELWIGDWWWWRWRRCIECRVFLHSYGYTIEVFICVDPKAAVLKM